MINHTNRNEDAIASSRAFEEMRIYAADHYLTAEDAVTVGEVVISRLKEIYVQMEGTI